MSKMVQIRNVPDPVHRKLKSRAALAGTTLSDYLLREVRLIAMRPSLEELLKRMAKQFKPVLKRTPADVLREERNSR